MGRVGIPYLAAAASAVFALTAAGCGSSGSSTTSAQDWASGVCTAFSTWETSLKDLQSTATSGGLSKSSLSAAVDSASAATQTLAASLKKLGKPNTQSGQQAKDDVSQLSDELNKGAKTISDAIASANGAAGVLTAASTIGTTLVTMSKDVSSTVTSLQTLDPKGELQRAFKQADSCKALSKQ